MMASCSSVMKALVFLTFSLHLSSAVKHSLQYVYTAVTPGINFPEFTAVGQVDGQQFDYYDSKIRKVIPKTQWIQNNEGEDYWNKNTQTVQGTQEIFKVNMGTLMQRFNQTTGVHTVQKMYGCEVDDDGTVTGYMQYGYDGEDFFSLDLKTLSWVAPTPQSVITKNKWDSNTGLNKNWENYLKNICPEWVQKYLTYGKHTLERKDRPEASLFQEEASSPEVVCHATGFFPKALMISWKKNGQNVLTDVDLRETLLNQDGSFQKRSILKVSAEELQKHTYTCVIEHSSLEKDLVLPVSERRILRGGGLIGIIVGVIVALVVLVAVVAGIVVWKKKNSGFKSVPSRASSDGDSNESESVRVRVPAE
ncbi:BOLA class I histocompatibility antigen, alpha chain BL3-7-like isoform X4 [Silurus meridionalis]|uniref:BOLA class I histocompatibility antigen, alpha chain BL3-7-like isoform X4 n=1 Tax=Silurus meridionalis TaxID=175797 RepID=UPI001EEAB7D5|nr:BOLA class I histocompatibility antigen, alpha chain BL3-7-like isoform X4 [Silurus meridionalis]